MLPLPPQFLHPGGLSRAVAALDAIKSGVEHKQLKHLRLERTVSSCIQFSERVYLFMSE
jgi:hypothetical protein